MGKYKIQINDEQITFYQMKELLKLLIEVLKQKGVDLTIDDTKIEIAGTLRKHLKKR